STRSYSERAAGGRAEGSGASCAATGAAAVQARSAAAESQRETGESTPKPPGTTRPSLALAVDPVVAPPARDDGHASSSLLGLGRDCGAIIRSIQGVSAFPTAALATRPPGAVARRPVRLLKLGEHAPWPPVPES